MNISEFAKPITSKSLNESLARRFGSKLELNKFTLEQLQDARNKLRTRLSQVEMSESFSAVIESDSYQKSKLMLDVLNAEITERGDIEESARPDYIDIDGDGDTEEPMKKAAKDAKKKKVKEGRGGDFEAKFRKLQNRGGSIAYAVFDLIQDYGLDAQRIMGFHPQVDQRKVRQFQIDRQERVLQMVKQQLGESVIREGAEDQAEIVMAAKDMVDRVTNWMEDTAEMQTESMLELADAIRDEMGSEASASFVQTVKPALEQMYAQMEQAREALSSGVGQLTGEQPAATAMGAEEPLPPAEGELPVEEPAMEPTIDQDEFAAAAPAAGGAEPAARPARESVDPRKLGKVLASSKKK
jgi:hypothetical protein